MSSFVTPAGRRACRTNRGLSGAFKPASVPGTGAVTGQSGATARASANPSGRAVGEGLTRSGRWGTMATPRSARPLWYRVKKHFDVKITDTSLTFQRKREQITHTLRSLLDELATQTRNTIRLTGTGATFVQLTEPTELQARAHDLATHADIT
jgi:hypothetical protein